MYLKIVVKHYDLYFVHKRERMPKELGILSNLNSVYEVVMVLMAKQYSVTLLSISPVPCRFCKIDLDWK